MDFALTALFVVLALEQWQQLHQVYPFLIAAICGLSALMLAEQHMLLVAITLSVAILILSYRRAGEAA